VSQALALEPAPESMSYLDGASEGHTGIGKIENFTGKYR
jgi:hypothetical protein